MPLKFKFPPPPNFYPNSTSPEAPLRVNQMAIESTDGSGVCIRFKYADEDDSIREKVSMSLPAALKLAEVLNEAVDGYLYDTGEEIADED